MSSQDLIGVGQAAMIVDLSERTVKRLAKDGELPFVTKLEGDRGAYVFDRSAVVDYADRKQAERRARLDERQARLDAEKAALTGAEATL